MAFKMKGFSPFTKKDKKNKDGYKEFKIGKTTFTGPYTEKELADAKKVDKRYKGGRVKEGKKTPTLEEFRNWKKVSGFDAYNAPHPGVRPVNTSPVPGNELD